VGIATLLEFDENNRFLTASCDPLMSHTFKPFYKFYLKKRHNGLFSRKLFEVRIKLEKMLKD
jgi:hypothetical protein